MINRYEVWLIKELQKIDNFPHEDIKLLDKYPLEIGRQVLRILIENSCLGQNYASIELARKKLVKLIKIGLSNILLRWQILVLVIVMNGNIDDWLNWLFL